MKAVAKRKEKLSKSHYQTENDDDLDFLQFDFQLSTILAER